MTMQKVYLAIFEFRKPSGAKQGVTRWGMTKFENGMLSHSCVVKKFFSSKYGQVTPQISPKLMLNTNIKLKLECNLKELDQFTIIHDLTTAEISMKFRWHPKWNFYFKSMSSFHWSNARLLGQIRLCVYLFPLNFL